MVIKMITELLRTKYDKTTFYCHNLGGFDVVFLLKELITFNQNLPVENSKIESENKQIEVENASLKKKDKKKPLKKLLEEFKLQFKFRNSNILAITIYQGKNKLTIKDSMTILTSNLKDLAEVYECVHQKGFFPYKFSNTSNLFYEGIIPDISYFVDISREEYEAI